MIFTVMRATRRGRLRANCVSSGRLGDKNKKEVDNHDDEEGRKCYNLYELAELLER